MQELVQQIVNYGVTAIVIAYFIFKDYKQSNQITDLTGAVNNNTIAVTKLIEKLNDK